ncbi:MAG: NAD(P)/FAD-dependent oxidoreductase [Phycisphaerales bacterium]|nr:NAD(P)/FAD-dependent oxidoreductase [Phycisphaerales bacterium]
MSASSDVLIVGAGHNGLVAAAMLARSGLTVKVIEERARIGGATKTEHPFPKAPRLGTSTASYLLGVMPPEIMARTGVEIEVVRRNPHYFLPLLDGRSLLLGTDQAAMRDQFLAMFSEEDWRANGRLSKEIGEIRDDLAPSWLEEPMGVEGTADRYIRGALREPFINLVTGTVEDYLARFGFQSELLVAMYAVTDGFSGLSASFGTPGTGMNFLVHNMCRLPGADGTWMVAKGGMGAVAVAFAEAAKRHGAEIEAGTGVARIITTGGVATGVALADGRELHARAVIVNADPFRLREMVGRAELPAELNTRIDGFKRTGTTMKINMALRGLPVFKCLPEDRGQFNGTMHLLPQGAHPIAEIKAGYDKVVRGELADCPTIEWYIHTRVDPSLRDPEGNHNGAFFIQWVPYELTGTSWAAEESRYVEHIFGIAEQFCPGLRDLVVDTHILTPPKIESEFGIRFGHIHHVDNTFGFDRRMPYSTGVAGLYSCSAGCHPAGSVIGASGHNCAERVMRDLGVAAGSSQARRGL